MVNLAGIGAVLMLLTGMSGLAPQDRIIKITEKGYAPDRVDITAGQKVVFQNVTTKDHTVMSRPAGGGAPQDIDKTGFNSGVIKPGTTWEFTPSKDGSYPFVCKEDPSMTGTIVVDVAK